MKVFSRKRNSAKWPSALRTGKPGPKCEEAPAAKDAPGGLSATRNLDALNRARRPGKPSGKAAPAAPEEKARDSLEILAVDEEHEQLSPSGVVHKFEDDTDAPSAPFASETAPPAGPASSMGALVAGTEPVAASGARGDDSVPFAGAAGAARNSTSAVSIARVYAPGAPASENAAADSETPALASADVAYNSCDLGARDDRRAGIGTAVVTMARGEDAVAAADYGPEPATDRSVSAAAHPSVSAASASAIDTMGSHAAPAEQVPSDAGHKLVPASFTPKDEPPLTLELGSSSATMDGPSFTTEDDTPFTPTDAPAPTLVNMEQLQVIFPPPEAGQSEDRLAADTAQQLAEPKDRMHITPSPPESGQFGDPRQGNSAVPDAVNKPLAEHNNSLLSSLPPDAAHELAEPAMVARANPGEGRMGVQRGGGWKRNGSHSSLSSLATLDSDEESESVGAHPFAPGANSFGAGTDSSGAGPDALAAGPDALAAGEGSSAVGPNSLGAGHHVVAREEANLDAADDTPLIEVDTMVAYHDAAPPKEPFPAASDDTPLIEVDKMVAGHDAAAPEEPFPAASDDTPRSVMAQPETPAGMRTNDEARAASAAPSEKLEMPVAPSVPEAVCNPGPRQQIPETRTIDEARATSAAPSEKLETPIAPPVEESVSKPGPKQQIPETPPPAAALPDPAATYRIGGFADAAAAGPAAARDSDPAGDPALARKEADSTSKLVHVAAGTDAVVKQAANQVAEGTRANETASNRPAEMGAPVASAPAIASRSELGRALMAYGTILLDVRAAAERAAAPLPIPSVSCPVGLEAPGCDELLARAPKLLPRTNTPVVAFCGSGRRAAVAIAALETMGYSKLLNGGSADNVLACLMAGS